MHGSRPGTSHTCISSFKHMAGSVNSLCFFFKMVFVVQWVRYSCFLAVAIQPSHSGVHDGSKCADKNGDCCASKNWGEPQACKDGYIPVPTGAKHCPSTYKECAKISDGIGCYGCYSPWSSPG